jgi:hypothetical protein
MLRKWGKVINAKEVVNIYWIGHILIMIWCGGLMLGIGESLDYFNQSGGSRWCRFDVDNRQWEGSIWRTLSDIMRYVCILANIILSP